MALESRKRNIYRLVLWALFAALVYAGSMMSVPIPVAVGNVSRIHLGNIFCLLSGFILGPIGGGLASGLGSALYDALNPAYIASAPFTFVFKFLLAAVCGWIAYGNDANAERIPRNIVAAVCGSITYIILYLGKNFISGLLIGSELGTVLTATATRLATSSANALVAVVVSVPLCAAIRAALKKSGLMAKI